MGGVFFLTLKPTVRPAWILTAAIVAGLMLAVAITSSPVSAQEGPTVVDPNLRVNTVVGGLVTPSSIAFLGPNEFLVAEKNTGMVKRVVNGVVQSTVLDLSVNNSSERGLLGLALHPGSLRTAASTSSGPAEAMRRSTAIPSRPRSRCARTPR